jgi:hypothetical protein
MDAGKLKPGAKDLDPQRGTTGANPQERDENLEHASEPIDADPGCTCGHQHGDDAEGCAHHAHSESPDNDYDPDDESYLGSGAPTVDEPAPELIDELAAACVRFVHDTIKVELDYTAETLPLLDHYLGIARGLIDEKPELRELVFRAAGAYFGEVLRRQLNGFWLLPSEDVHTWRVCGRHVLLSINPVGVIAEAIAESEDSQGPNSTLHLSRHDQEEVAQRLAEMPPLPENEFFLTSTRLEVIDVVVEHLRLRMEQNQQADMEFDVDDYSGDLKAYGRA